MRFTAFILTMLFAGCVKSQPPVSPSIDTVRSQFHTDGKIPCRSSLYDSTLDNSAFCLSSVSQEFAKQVTVEMVTFEQTTKAIEGNTPLPWSNPRPVGNVAFAYGSHESINRMSAMKIHETWYYMWGESAWYKQVEPREDRRTCETVEVTEQGFVQFCSKDAELLKTEVHALRALIERVAGAKM